MRKKAIVIVVMMLCVPALAFGAGKFGIIFDVKGDAMLTRADGKTVNLLRARHILLPVEEGDTLEVRSGRVLFVAVKGKEGYSLLSGSSVAIRGGEVKTLKGEVEVSKGYSVPTGVIKGPIGVGIMRNVSRETCIAAISPVNTAVISTAPKLIWRNDCIESREVVVRVLEDRVVVFEKVSDSDSITLPTGVLKEDMTYRWTVDCGRDGIVGATFKTLGSEAVKTVSALVTKNKAGDSSLPERLTYLFLLKENNIRNLAESELARLKSDFPENEFIMQIQ
jgi:hypothetical protein